MTVGQPARALRVALVAGEASGDLLGADLLKALRERVPDVVAEGVTGPALRAAGCETLEDMESLSVMGLGEVVGELPRLMALRRRLLAHWREQPPDVLIGVDAPDFNLGLERRLRRPGLTTVHYVSPTVWAWRPGRVRGIAAAADLVLCLLPFEPECYAGAPVDAVFVGHPFAREMRAVPSREHCREQLGVAPGEQMLALAPGSRAGEIERTGRALFAAAVRLRRKLPELVIHIPAASAKLRTAIDTALAAEGLSAGVQVHDGQLREVVRAADAALVTSGTAALEAMLLGTPFAVAYRASPLTDWLMRRVGLLKIQQVSLPNILAGREVAPELLQRAAEPGNLAATAYLLLTRPDMAAAQLETFAPLIETLDRPSGELAADAVLRACSAA